MLTWQIQTSRQGKRPVIISEYVLNDLGIFIKREKRMPKKAPLTATTGFRIGYEAVNGTDYRAAPLDRNALVWHKITAVTENGEDAVIVKGNRNGEIMVCFMPEDKDKVLEYIADLRRQHPAFAEADEAAAAWICWSEDDEWIDPYMPLSEMIQIEQGTDRFLEQEVIEETILDYIP